MFETIRKSLAMALMPKLGKGVGGGSYAGYQLPNIPVYTDMTVRKATREGYKISVYVYRAVRTIIQAASAIPWIILDKNGEPIDNHPLTQVFKWPNPEFSGQDLIEYTIAHLELAGNALWQPIIMGNQIKEIWPVMPDMVQPIPSDKKGEWLKGWQVSDAEGKQQILPPETFIHFQQVNPGNLYWGVSPLLAAAKTIDTDNEAQDTQKLSMQNRGVTDIAFIHESPLDAAQFEEARRQIRENFLNRNRRREPWILGAGTKVQQLSMTAVEMDYIASRLTNKRDIAAAFGISPIFLGDMEQSTMDNMKQSRKGLYEDVVIPLLDDIKSTLNMKLARLYGDIEIAYDVSNVVPLREDLGQKVEQAKTLWAMGVPFDQINDKLELGFEEFTGWDVGYLPLTLMPAGSPTVEAGKMLAKSLNLETEEQKAAHWKRVDRRRMGWWRVASGKITPLYEAEGKAIDKAIRGSQPGEITRRASEAIESQQDKWEKTIVAISSAVIEDFGNEIAVDLGGKPKSAKYEAKWEFEPFTVFTRQWVASHAAEGVKSILETSKADVAAIIEKGIVDKQTTPQIAKQLRQFYTDRSSWKAMRVARTEVGAAAGFGQREAARQSGVTKTKAWISARDSRCRDSHIAMDSQTHYQHVPFDEPYPNGLMNPGDTSGDPAEFVNCRCAEQYFSE